jgi:hypothetical protein
MVTTHKNKRNRCMAGKLLTFYKVTNCIQVTCTSKIYYYTSSHDSTLCVDGVTSTSRIRASAKILTPTAEK